MEARNHSTHLSVRHALPVKPEGHCTEGREESMEVEAMQPATLWQTVECA